MALVIAAKANGATTEEAATANSPIFLQYSKMALGAAIVLAAAELMDFMQPALKTKLDKFRYLAGFLCIALVCVFSLNIVPPMERLLPDIKTVKEAHEQFHHLHELSRAVFGSSILMAYIALLLPLFKKDSTANAASKESKEDRALPVS